MITMYSYLYISKDILNLLGRGMDYKVYTLTAQKFDELKIELHKLMTVGRKERADELNWVRDISNIREDSAYIAALDEKHFLEKKILEIKNILHNCEIMKTRSNKDGMGNIGLGSRVKVAFNNYSDEFMIVSALEADPLNKKISDQSPVGRALLGAKPGQSIKVVTETLEQEYKVLEVS